MGHSEQKTKNFLGIDIGTTSLKAAVFDADGNRKGVRAVDYTLDTDAETGFIEFDAEEYINMSKEKCTTNDLARIEGKIDRLLELVSRTAGAQGFGTDILANILGNILVGR